MLICYIVIIYVQHRKFVVGVYVLFYFKLKTVTVFIYLVILFIYFIVIFYHDKLQNMYTGKFILGLVNKL